MDNEGSLARLQDPDTSAYNEPDLSSPRHQFFSWKSILILFSYLRPNP
jgi:hypothetical protein